MKRESVIGWFCGIYHYQTGLFCGVVRVVFVFVCLLLLQHFATLHLPPAPALL
jgi:hypothetical protein